ncbi:STM4014 family protein [Nonomuraea longicatena]|uniref:STM4014 family protein n=1 Tax=Nonomuraea longicatena TaxID=83682 RepID=A0ABN1QF39_9ACTN
MTPLVVVGVPGDRRTRLFAEAAARCGLGPPEVVAWRQVLTSGPPPLPDGALVRLESPGEDAEVDALLRGPGAPTRVGGGARWHEHFVRALHRVREAVAATPGARLAGDVGEIAVMFDKRRCHALLEAAGVPVPPALPGFTDSPPGGAYERLRARMAEAGWPRVFVKPAHGSSASGVVALNADGERVRAVTSAAFEDDGLHNSLRVRTYGREPDVARLVAALAPDGLHVERWFPKASLGGRVIDLRVVVIGGTPTHAVVRAALGPITNLHLGAARGDLDGLRDRLGARRWAAALDVCAQAAACFPASPMTAVDLMVGTDLNRFAVAEVNAFGDLLPGLTGLPGTAEGLDTYTAQLHHLKAVL